MDRHLRIGHGKGLKDDNNKVEVIYVKSQSTIKMPKKKDVVITPRVSPHAKKHHMKIKR
ncbi:hypothetical protein M8C21_001340 [Ambrosia artemisiifolia]|uniref:Uncharacterized protein n=1 Tax=Ambrosia artemisiifolia TaxID=4212 RepID=A0AAD5GR52_AMBAR|nr:hypothetical protein M8C21_001340 [Ambrosia artemisiifolia]